MLQRTFDELNRELEFLKNSERARIAKIIDEARELGDLKENAEYHAAKDRQGLMEARINELSDLIARAQVVDPATLTHERVSFGSTVTIVDIDSEEEFTYTIVSSVEADPTMGYISFASPMAKALLGKEEGDEVEVILPEGKRTFEVDTICYEPIKPCEIQGSWLKDHI